MRINTVQGPAAQPSVQTQKATVRREDPTSISSISKANRPNFFLQLPFALFRMATFVLSLLIYRTPKLKALYIPEMTSADRKTYERYLSGYWTDFGFLRTGPSYSQKMQLLHQFFSFQKQTPNSWGIQISTNMNVNGKHKKVKIKPDFLNFISNPENYEKGKDARVELQFKLKRTFNFGIGPYRVKQSTLTTRNTLGADGTSFTSEVTKKRVRTSYQFFR